MSEPVWLERFIIADRLKISIDEVMEMPVETYLCWREYIKREQAKHGH